MKDLKNTLKAAAVLLLTMLSLCGCGENNSEIEYEHLKTDIVGMWMNEGGPNTTENSPVGKALQFFEFTSDGKVYHHYIYMHEEGIPAEMTSGGSPYRIDGNMFVNEDDNTGALITIEGNTMTMSNNSGANVYTKLSVEDATGYYLYYNDENLLAEQQEFKASLEGYYDEETDSSDTSDTENAEDTESESDSSDTDTEAVSEENETVSSEDAQ